MTLIDAKALMQYLATAQAREQERQEALVERTQRAWEVARRAAELLRREFGASKVILLGSLANHRFSLWSDIDLATWDIARDDYFVAVAHVLDVADEFEINLFEALHCRPSLRKAIEEGVEL